MEIRSWFGSTGSPEGARMPPALPSPAITVKFAAA